ncbi:MAG: protein-L-isoaspartate(D-aspartate) O-methyltransferase [Deltaproteobacteria bacterium]|nr:MAG: protein-L-isoaspartate(D-aspartate) O-methyltransferase [Deltaproteobacteria bacterium]
MEKEDRRGRLKLTDFALARKKMVEEQLVPRGIKDDRVLRAMRKVPRHLFLEEGLWPQAYGDFPLPIGEGQTISQPYIVALMTEAMELKGDEKALEIGTGSGYQAAILAELAERVFTVERISSLAGKARKILDELGYADVLIKVFDGTHGWKEEAPFDGIIVTAGAPDVPQTLLRQLKVGGRLVIPVGNEYSQILLKVVREDRGYKEDDLGGCRFVKLIGDHGWKT